MCSLFERPDLRADGEPNPSASNYPPKLDAAIKAWQAVTAEPAPPEGQVAQASVAQVAHRARGRTGPAQQGGPTEPHGNRRNLQGSQLEAGGWSHAHSDIGSLSFTTATHSTSGAGEANPTQIIQR